MGRIPKMDSVPLNTDLAELAKLQDKLEEILLDQLGIFIEEHPAANSARFGVAVFLGVAGRIGISHLGADTTAKCMEDVAATVRSHGKKKSKVH